MNALKQEKQRNIPERKTIIKLYKQLFQTVSVEELDQSGRPKIDQNKLMQVETILCENNYL